MSFPAWVSGNKKNEAPRSHSGIGHGSVPRGKKPKTRPPSSLRDRAGFLHGTLPKYSGPYSVGVMDIEVPAENPRNFSHITRHGQHILKLETVLMAVYYPTAIGVGSGRDPAGHKKWSRETWLPRPRIKMARGYGKFAGIGDIAVPWFAGTTMFTKLPAYRNAPVSQHWPPRDNLQHGGPKVKSESGPPPPGESEEPCFPLMIFSHGLGGTRTAYSSVCGEFASYGFVVCAVEHRDGSGARTFVNHAQSGVGSMKEREAAGPVDHDEKERRRGYDQIDYIFPKDNPYDTIPSNDKGVDSELRNAQLQLRLAEIKEAYSVMRHIDGGRGGEIANKNLRRKGYIGSSSRGLDGVDWAQWKDRIHCHRVTVLGHSFGAATTVEILRNADRFQYVGQGVIYDIWGAAVSPPAEEPRHRIHCPLLGINSEAFMYWPSNFNAVHALIDEAKKHAAPSWLLTVRGTIHVSQSDFSILYPKTCAMLLKMTANPKRALDLNVSATLEFLKKVMPQRSAMIDRSFTDEGLLDAEPVEELPTEHKPEKKWTAARLKIPHEFRSRFVPKITRKISRKRRQNQKHDPNDEIWMHVTSSEEEVTAWNENKSKRGEGDDPGDPGGD
ncbi:hypothetical protein H2201_007873 [Coniosporium apollinis]|uniref:Uncharacterized protein n=2 Tax=Coniosporium TaxID=2810619 RepID=A0ACC2ZG07_9PEZI|nr:hypothetical protein H2199_002377 [Cladosporium sp. JES 115]KAJ9658200.1 hypothetical protein H2201_007873 [Coniosporium apollinis]